MIILHCVFYFAVALQSIVTPHRVTTTVDTETDADLTLTVLTERLAAAAVLNAVYEESCQPSLRSWWEAEYQALSNGHKNSLLQSVTVYLPSEI